MVQNQHNSNGHPAFRLVRQQRIDSLSIDVQLFEHIKTGAVHIHLQSDNAENVFMVAFRTVPEDSTGVAHILEHTALCGSKRYPVRDPFFMMIRRSLNTFMNAFTSSDWTAYPFASQIRADFDNLLNIYLDAAFFSRLDPLDFSQEGHRLEFSDPNDPDSPLVIKGVVFNEMKGAMSSPVTQVWQHLTHHLYPTATYHFNSGGEPSEIVNLSYEQLKAFYESHYHPSNAIFMTFGDIPAHDHQLKFEELALKDFGKLDQTIEVTDEERYSQPLSAEAFYTIDTDDCKKKTYLMLAWLLGTNTDLYEVMKCELVSGVLLNNSASPLRHFLETSPLGSNPSAICGLESSFKEMAFVCGLEGGEASDIEEFENQVLSLLSDLTENGLDQTLVDAVLHQLELSQREITGGSYPYGLQLLLSALPTAIHRGDVIGILDLDSVLERLRQDLQNPDFLKNTLKQMFLENTHRVRLAVKPDPELASRLEEAEQKRLTQIKSDLTEEAADAIKQQALLLEERQNQKDDCEILPKLELSDIPATRPVPSGKYTLIGKTPGFIYPTGTNGLVYQQYVTKLPDFTSDQRSLLSLMTSCMDELGYGDKDYRQRQVIQSNISGGISSSTQIRSAVDNEQKISSFFVQSGKSLTRNQPQLTQLMHDLISEIRFDEHEHIREIFQRILARKEQAITGEGHSLAMMAAVSKMSPVAGIMHDLNGLSGILSLRKLVSELDSERLATIEQSFGQMLEMIRSMPKIFCLIAENEQISSCLENIEKIWQGGVKENPYCDFSLPEIRESVSQAWITNTQVNFCARAYPTVSIDHPDCAALRVLGQILRNGYLHRVIREQGGAYGGGAMQDSAVGAFKFFSYRDPKLEQTLTSFDESITWLLNHPISQQDLEQGILGIIGSIDKPGSPAGEAKQAFYDEIHGRTVEQRQRYRREVLEVTSQKLKEVTEKYLLGAKSSTAVISSEATFAAIDKRDYDVFRII